MLRIRRCAQQFAAQLISEGVVTQEEADELVAAMQARLRAGTRAAEAVVRRIAAEGRKDPARRDRPRSSTAVDANRLRELNEELLAVPEGFTVHPKLAKQLERRAVTIEEGGIDWGQAEALAFASLLVEGLPVRLSGQDTERGTFSHRHLVLHDAENGRRWAPMQHLADATASFEVFNSPLSEFACVGFEYGYSVAAPESLVLWEAQFGDFVNGAQTSSTSSSSAGCRSGGRRHG